MLQKGDFVQIKAEYQYNCSSNDTNMCLSFCKDQCQLNEPNYLCMCAVGEEYRQKLTVEVRTYGEHSISL